MEERIAIMQHDGGLPPEWAESLAKVTLAPKPKAYTEERWSIITEDACLLMRHLPKILGNAWSPADIKALLPHIKGRPVAAVGIADITVLQDSGDRAKIYRRPNGDGTAYWVEGKRG